MKLRRQDGSTVEIEVGASHTGEQFLANVKINAARNIPWFNHEAPAHDGHLVIVGGGPSAKDAIPEIRFRQKRGQTIWALNGVADLLAGNGVVPDSQIMLDASDAEDACLAFVRKKAAKHYYLASQCSPKLFDYLSDKPVTGYHYAIDGIFDLLPKGPYHVLGGGYTVGLVSMGLGHASGFRRFHLYGYDSSYRGEEIHAYHQPASGTAALKIEVGVGDQKFTTSYSMLAQAEAFHDWSQLLTEYGAQIAVYGDGLLPALVRSNQQRMAD